MSYHKPEDVKSPQDMVSDVQVVYDGGEHNWSVAKLRWGGQKAVGIRWNGGPESEIPDRPATFPGLGNPQSRGYPTWFIVPEELHDAVLAEAKKQKKQGR